MSTAKRHRCQSWCHKCPDLIAIVAGNGGDITDPLETTMPMCMGGSLHGLDGCHCNAFDGHTDRRHVSTRKDRIALLRELIVAYPTHARMLVADLAPPKETEHPRLRSIDGGAA